jgi:hypothetical protein
MADEIGTVRVELVADPSGIQRGIEQASGALTRMAAVGTFVGNTLTTAFFAVAERFTETVTEIISGQGNIWDELSKDARNAATLLHNSFNEMGEGATQFQASIAERVLPGLAALVEKFTEVASNSTAAKIGVELLVGAFKVLATAAVLVLTTIQLLGQALATVGNAATAFGSALNAVGAALLTGNFAAAGQALANLPAKVGEALKAGGTDIAQTLRDSAKLVGDVWNEAAISTERAGARIVVENEKLDRHMRRLGEQAKKVFEDTRTPFERLQFQIDRLNVLLEHGLISWDTYQRAVQQATDKISGAQEAMRAVGQSFEAAFVDAVTGAKSLQDALKSLLKDLARIAAQQVFRQLFGSAFGFIGKGSSSGFGAAPTGGGGLPGFASGGSFEVGGAGGIDSQVVAFRATPGEMVAVGHDRATGKGSGSAPKVTVNNYSNAEVTTERGRDDELIIAVRGIVQDEFASGRMNPLMAQNYGVRPRVRSR